MEKAKTNWGVVIKISGVFVSWAIGSGFVTGAESMSYWCGYGIWAVSYTHLTNSHAYTCDSEGEAWDAVK